jgi:hypothetical protein
VSIGLTNGKHWPTWNPNVEFIKVNEFNDNRDKTNMLLYHEWHGTPNIKYINFEQLDKELGI